MDDKQIAEIEHEQEEIKELLEETKELTEENNQMLKSIRRLGMIELVMRIAWYAVLIGLPFAIYYYVLDPYFKFFGTSYSEFNQELPGSDFLSRILGR